MYGPIVLKCHTMFYRKIICKHDCCAIVCSAAVSAANLRHHFLSWRLLSLRSSISRKVFSPSPVLPLAFYLQARKMAKMHGTFFDFVASVVPEIQEAKNLFIVTDGEIAITSSIKKNFPKLPTFLCWNHLIQAI